MHLPTMAALSQLIPSGLYSPDGISPALLSAASAFGARSQRDAAPTTVFSMAESSLAQKFRMGSELSNMPFIPAPAEKKRIKLYSGDYYAVSIFFQSTSIWHARHHPTDMDSTGCRRILRGYVCADRLSMDAPPCRPVP